MVLLFGPGEVVVFVKLGGILVVLVMGLGERAEVALLAGGIVELPVGPRGGIMLVVLLVGGMMEL